MVNGDFVLRVRPFRRKIRYVSTPVLQATREHFLAAIDNSLIRSPYECNKTMPSYIPAFPKVNE